MFGAGPMLALERITAFCLLLFVVVGITADQLLGKVGIDATFLPELFKSKTLPASSLQKLESNSEAAATDTARLAVLKQPLWAEALEVLAKSSATSKPQMSTELLVQAAALGWRNIAVQATVIRSAASARNWDAAAPRLLALTKLNSLDAIDHSIFVTTDAGEYAPQIVPAFADDGLAWLKFVNWLRGGGLEGEAKYLLAQTPSYSDKDTCHQLGTLARQFVQTDEIEFAINLIGSRCRGHLTAPSSGLTIDEHFGEVRRGPFEWQMISHSGVSFRTGSVNGKKVVEVVNVDPLPRKVAVKLIPRVSLDKSKIFSLGDMRSPGSMPEVLPLYYECVAFPGRHKEFLRNYISSIEDDCLVFRVGFQLPSGRFRVWSE